MIGGILALIALIGLVLYWQLVIAEGVYLGQRVVTWLYDITAHRYDDIKQYQPSAEAQILGRPLVHMLEGAPLVLDVGTGTGRQMLALLEQRDFQGRVIGVDHSRKMLHIAAEKLAPFGDRATLLWRDASRLPFPDDTFDAVTLIEMLEFTPDPAHQIGEAVRVLRPGGMLVTSRRRGLDALLMPGKTHSPPQFEAMLKSYGLRGVQIMPWQSYYDLVWAVLPGGEPRWHGPHPLEALRCPDCHRTAFVQYESGLRCDHCSRHAPVEGGIINLNA